MSKDFPLVLETLLQGKVAHDHSPNFETLEEKKSRQKKEEKKNKIATALTVRKPLRLLV